LQEGCGRANRIEIEERGTKVEKGESGILKIKGK